eukprot:jgi/Tetstr1/460389/TSEL_000067.t1
MRTRIYDTHIWACAEPPLPTAAPVVAGGDGDPAVAAAPYGRHAYICSVHTGSDKNAGRAGCIDTVAAAIATAAISATLASPKRINEPRPQQRLSTKEHDDGTSAVATLMEAALNLCEWKLKHNIKTAAFEKLSKLLKKHMLPKDGSDLTETSRRDIKTGGI